MTTPTLKGTGAAVAFLCAYIGADGGERFVFGVGHDSDDSPERKFVLIDAPTGTIVLTPDEARHAAAVLGSLIENFPEQADRGGDGLLFLRAAADRAEAMSAAASAT